MRAGSYVVAMGAGVREQSMQYMMTVRRDGTEKSVICTTAQLLGSEGSWRQISKPLRFRDEALKSTTLASI